MLKLVTFTSLYPNEVMPRHGVFVEERLRQLVRTGEVEARVLAPVPWFPFPHGWFGRYGRLARVPRHENRDGIVVTHPRYPVVPKIGMSLAPFLMAAFLLPRVWSLKRRFGRDLVIDSHFLYPDGVAATMIGRLLRLPVVMTARGSDVTLFTQYTIPRALILWASRLCSRIVTVSGPLAAQLREMGASADKIAVLRNGVDLTRFRPMDRDAARRQLHVDGNLLLTVGNLVELKGHQLAVQAMVELRDARLIIIGEGPMASELCRLADRLKVGDRVTICGNVGQEELVTYYNAADALVLPSSREGMPNVILESIACGTPVIATGVGGVSEVIRDPAAGIILRERSPAAIVEAFRQLLARPRDRMATRAWAEQFGWTDTVSGLLEVFRGARTH